jgi:hypothetical protein
MCEALGSISSMGEKKIKLFLLHTALSDEGLSERIGDEKF